MWKKVHEPLCMKGNVRRIVILVIGSVGLIFPCPLNRKLYTVLSRQLNFNIHYHLKVIYSEK